MSTQKIKIEYCVIEEGNLRAVKDTGTFGGPNMWHLHVKNTHGIYDGVQWMNRDRIQAFFKTVLPKYPEIEYKNY